MMARSSPRSPSPQGRPRGRTVSYPTIPYQMDKKRRGALTVAFKAKWAHPHRNHFLDTNQETRVTCIKSKGERKKRVRVEGGVWWGLPAASWSWRKRFFRLSPAACDASDEYPRTPSVGTALAARGDAGAFPS